MKEKLSLSELNVRKNNITENYKYINSRIADAISKSNIKNGEVKFLAATKTVPAELIIHAIECGIKYIGENRVQEFLEKYDDLKDMEVEHHFIGTLQSNKVKYLCGKVSFIQSVSSISLAQEISRVYSKNNFVADIMLEVNIGNEQSKSGFSQEEVYEAAEIIDLLPNINVKGIMAIPPYNGNRTEIRAIFENISNISIDIASKMRDNSKSILISMGMSNDYYEAILEGANVVRIGSALFGDRIYNY